MEGVVENSLEAVNYLTDKHFDKGWDKYRKHVNGKKVEEVYVPYRGPFTDPDKTLKESSSHSSSSRKRDGRRSRSPTATARTASRAAPRSNLITPAAAAATGAAVGATSYTAASYPGSRRRQRNSLPSPEREAYRPGTLQQESEESDRVLRDYEEEVDDPKRAAESVLDSTDLNYIKESRRASVVATSILKVKDTRRDSAMASGYNDDYRGGDGYARDAPRPRSQPPRNRYYDDDDSDYDERSGRRYKAGSGRGYDDDRDYDRVVEETERYRGPVSSGPLVPMNRPLPTREESYRSGTEGPYGAGTVAQYGRRSDGALDRQGDSYVSRRTRGSRGRDRSYSRSPSRSRSGSRERGGGIQDKIQGAFDTSGRGLGVGIAGAVIGGLAGREFGQKHRQRDIILGAIVGGLGANAAENQWREYKNKKERNLEVDEERWEQKFDGRDYGRSRSNVR